MISAAEVPPASSDGSTATLSSAVGSTFSDVDFVNPLYVADMLAVVDAVTEPVVIVNVVLVDSSGIVTEAGTVATGRSLLSVMVAPPNRAGPVRVIVALVGLPPATIEGLTSRETNESGAGIT